jgi:predicted outer membrane repeat protein
VIDANGLDRVLHQSPRAGDPVELVLRDLTLTGGRASGSGGGLLFAGPVDAERVIVTGNAASGSGGGIAATNVALDEPSLDLRVSTVSLNRAREGGGIFAAEPEPLSVERSIVVANTAIEDGGGVSASLEPVPIRLDRVTVYGNNAGDGFSSAAGGGVFAVRNLSLDRSWVGHNLVGSWGAPLPDLGRGGGVALFAGFDAGITNSTIEGNLAARGGGWPSAAQGP